MISRERYKKLSCHGNNINSALDAAKGTVNGCLLGGLIWLVAFVLVAMVFDSW